MGPTAVEIVSPMLFSDTDCVCRVSRTGLVATCAGCGVAVYAGVHLPLIAYGTFCPACCPCTTFVPTPEELHAMEANAMRGRADAARCRPVKPIAVKPRQAAPRVAALRLTDYRRSDIIRVLQPKTFHSPFRQGVWALLEDGMAVGELLTRCRPLGCRGRATIRWMIQSGWIGVTERTR